MTEFKKGDKVRVLGSKYGGLFNGDGGVITGDTTVRGDDKCYYIENEKGVKYYHWEGELELITNKKNIMSNLKEKFAMLMKEEPDKSFFKAGITNSDYSLTEEGKGVFLEWLLKKNGDAFKSEVVDGILTSMKEDK